MLSAGTANRIVAPPAGRPSRPCWRSGATFSTFQAEVFKDMTELRLAVDEMETLTSRACWPYPSYGDLLFSVK